MEAAFVLDWDPGPWFQKSQAELASKNCVYMV